ncbi:sodium-dependent bicarbonate transport family permease [Cytobacillus sp. FJAT-54145]|uniref:Sodium-dependent bicarbonate transport family permease n=1 Tax=Cytobacillus spartinae TaxID=3299023 RepID=A0ABW6KDM5_9BACI
MNVVIDIVYANLLSPMILFFILGIIAVLVNSDLKVPEAFYTGYTMIILFTIGIKGGTELRSIPLSSVVIPMLTAILLSLIMLFIAYFVLKYIFKYSKVDSLATAAHYGSVSAVTFTAGIAFIEKMGVSYESYISAILVVMEGPAIIVAIIIYKMMNKNKAAETQIGAVVKEAFFGKSIFLLIGGIIIGMIAHEEGLLKIKPFFGDLFYGILCIFLLHVGIVATQQIRNFKGIRFYSFAFAFVLPLIGGVLGVVVASLIGMSPGGAFMLGVLTASSSYIAAPAAISHSIPEANAGLALGSSLGLTLPFNLVVGIPFYFWLANNI